VKDAKKFNEETNKLNTIIEDNQRNFSQSFSQSQDHVNDDAVRMQANLEAKDNEIIRLTEEISARDTQNAILNQSVTELRTDYERLQSYNADLQRQMSQLQQLQQTLSELQGEMNAFVNTHESNE
jgi:predicted  nucleic acid-binding Zn-ribbon protein